MDNDEPKSFFELYIRNRRWFLTHWKAVLSNVFLAAVVLDSQLHWVGSERFALIQAVLAALGLTITPSLAMNTTKTPEPPVQPVMPELQ